MATSQVSTQLESRLDSGGRALIRELRNYLAGQVVGLTRDEALLDELLKCAFCRVSLQRTAVDTAALSADETATLYHGTFAEMRQYLYLLDLGQDLQLGPAHIAHVDAILSQLDLLDPRRDVVADIYQAFVGTAFRGQEGQFFTPQNAIRALVNIVQPSPDDDVLDPACGAGGFLLESGRHAIERGGKLPVLRGIDKDSYLVKLARIHVALQFGEHPSVVCADSLGSLHELQDAVGYGMGEHDVVLTNPPFGSKIVAIATGRRSEFVLAHRWRKAKDNGRYEQTASLASNAPPQVLFLERCIDLLRPGGRLGIVLPESTVSNASHRHMVQHMLDQLTPLAIIGMPEALFKTSGKGGTHTKVCLVVARKQPAPDNHRIFMAEARWCGHDSRGLPIDRDDLPEIVDRYRAFRSDNLAEEDPKGFSVALRDLRHNVLAPRYYDPEPRKALAGLALSHDRLVLGRLLEEGMLKVTTGDEVGKLAYGTGPVPFVRTSDLSSWEIKVDPKHCVSEELYRELAPRQDVVEGDILMVRDGTYLIGTCAMVTKHDVRMLYQSHLYKLRLSDDAPLDRFLLLAALSSPPVRAQIRACSFTQDIIDSLGDRIRELVIPIPKDSARRREISKLVERVIADRVEARELARRASLEVASADLSDSL
jgi:type I restriction enzyme M protein